MFIRRTIYDSCDLAGDQAFSAGLLRRLPFGARLQRCIDSATAQIDVVHIVIDFLESTEFSVPSFACFASVSCSYNLSVFHDNGSDVRMEFAVIFSDTLSSFSDCRFAESPIQGGLNEFRS